MFIFIITKHFLFFSKFIFNLVPERHFFLNKKRIFLSTIFVNLDIVVRIGDLLIKFERKITAFKLQII